MVGRDHTPKLPRPLWGVAHRRDRERRLDAAAPRSAAIKLGLSSAAPLPEPAERTPDAQARAEAHAFARGRDAVIAERDGLMNLLRECRAELVEARARLDGVAAECRAALAERDGLSAELTRARELAEAARQRAAREGEARLRAEAECVQLRAAAVPAPTLVVAPPPPAQLPPAPPAASAASPPIAPRAPAVPRAPVTAPSARASVTGAPTAPVLTPARVERPAVAAMRAAPPAPTPLQAPTCRGRVDLATAVGRLLIKAPPRPGAHAGHCFATLLDRASASLVGPALEADDDDASGRRDYGARLDRRAQEDLQALADLYRHADGLYRDLAVKPGDGLPLNGEWMRTASLTGLGGGAAAACVEAAHA